MKKLQVIKPDNLPTKLPLTLTIALYLLIDKLNSPQWIWGMFWTLTVILWACSIYRMWVEEQVEIFKNEK